MIVLILGSGPAAPQARGWSRNAFDRIVAINNAWAVRPDWDHLIFPEDFPVDRRPINLTPNQSLIEADQFVPAQNAHGGFLFAGATMAYTAAYWVLFALRPRVIAFFGCDMTYDGSQTHFYGNGAADPLRDDISLRCLEAKCARFMVHAASQTCSVVNLSKDPSRLIAPRATLSELPDARPVQYDTQLARDAMKEESRLDYLTPDGRHDHLELSADLKALAGIDALWLASVKADPFVQKGS